MAAEAAWYPDPTQEGRLRFWDGTGWTQHVSDPAPTSHPIDEAPPPTDAVLAALPTHVRGYPPRLAGRIGFAMAAVGALLVVPLTRLSPLVVQQSDGSMLWYAGERWRGVGTVAAVVCLLAAVARWMWVRLIGLAVASGAALTFMLIVGGTRSLLSPGLAPGVRVGLGTAGQRAAAAALLMFLGTVVALLWLRVPARTRDPARTPKRGKGTASLVLAVLGLFLPVLAAPAVGLGQLARDDDRLSAGRVRSRALGTAGIVLGAVALTLWAVGLTLAMFLAQPTFTSLR